jgi:hypothetical protein
VDRGLFMAHNDLLDGAIAKGIRYIQGSPTRIAKDRINTFRYQRFNQYL